MDDFQGCDRRVAHTVDCNGRKFKREYHLIAYQDQVQRAAILFQSIFLVFALAGSIHHLFLGHYNSAGLIMGFLLFIYLLNILTFLSATRKMEKWIREDFLHPGLG